MGRPKHGATRHAPVHAPGAEAAPCGSRSPSGGRERTSACSVRLPLVRAPCYPPPRRRAPAGTRVRAEIAQLVEHATENRGVASSILALGTNHPGSVIERKWLSW